MTAASARLDHAFGRRHLCAEARVRPRRVVERAGEGFEGRFGAVVVVFASKKSDVEVEAAVGRERLEQVRDHLAAQAAERWAAERQVDAPPAAAAEIRGPLGPGLVARAGRGAK